MLAGQQVRTCGVRKTDGPPRLHSLSFNPQYPFDKYEVPMRIHATLINPEDIREFEAVPVGLYMFEGEQGWETHSELSELTNAQGAGDNTVWGFRVFR